MGVGLLQINLRNRAILRAIATRLCDATAMRRVEDNYKKLGIWKTAEATQKLRNFFPLLKQLLANAEQNVIKVPQQRRHGQILKKFATSLFIYSGPLAYEFLQKNLPEALPSLRTVQRIVTSEFLPFHEGEFRFDELVTHLDS